MTGSIEHRLQSHAKAVHERLWGRPKIVNVAARMARPVLIPANTDKPSVRAKTPLDFIKMKCVDLGSTYDAVTGHDRSVEMVAIRRDVLKATRAKYPKISYTALGKLIGRDGTTVMNALGVLRRKRAGAQKRSERDRKALELYRQGVTIANIAETLGISQTTVKEIKTRCEWERRRKPKPAVAATRASEAREHFDKGMSYRQIGEVLGVSKAAVVYISKKHNWPKRGTNNGE